MDSKVEIQKSELIDLMNQNETQLSEIRQLYEGSMKIMELIGLAENGRMKQECLGPDANPFPEIMKGAGDLFKLVAQVPVPVIGRRAEAKLAEKFAFFKPLLPVFEKYGKLFQNS